jgi:septal ring factor EnvC (AmiA/AmiB activator)
VLSLEPGRDALGAVRSLRYLARRDHRAVTTYRETMARLSDERRVLAERREEADRWVARERERQRELVGVRKRQESILARHRSESQRLTGLAGDLAERENRLTTLLALVGAGQGTLDGRSVRDFRGVLDWPVAGRVTAEFGPRMDPRYRTRVPHRGLDLAPEPESEVRAVYGGRVLYAGAFEDLGNLVVVRHPGGVTTLTSGLETLRVAKDDVLGFESVLGRAGEALYFEIRVDQKPENPRQWLRPQLSRPLPLDP